MTMNTYKQTKCIVNLKFQVNHCTEIYPFLQISTLLLQAPNRNIIFLFPNQNICCGYSEEPSLQAKKSSGDPHQLDLHCFQNRMDLR